MRSFLASVFAIMMLGAQIIGFLIHLWTCYIAYQSGFLALVLTFFFPFASQLYWLYAIWTATGHFLNPYTVACIGTVALYFLGGIGATLTDDVKAPEPLTDSTDE